MNYYRITAYEKERDFSFIIDSHGRFNQLWEFSTYLVDKGFQVLDVSKQEKWLDVNIKPISENIEHLYLRATCRGKPEFIQHTINGITYKAVKVEDKIYIPNK